MEPILKGELWKQSGDEGDFWKKRFIKLYSTHLTYHVNEFTPALGEMHFEEDFFVQDGSAPKDKFGFVVTNFEVIHRLAADTKDVKEFWCVTIANLIREKLENAKYFEEARKNIKSVDMDQAETEDLKKLENYYKSVKRPAARQNRKSIVDFRAAQVFAQAEEAVMELEKAKEGTDKEKLKKEAERLASEAKAIQDQAEKENPIESVFLKGILEGDEAEELEGSVPPVQVVIEEEKIPPPKSVQNIEPVKAVPQVVHHVSEPEKASSPSKPVEAPKKIEIPPTTKTPSVITTSPPSKPKEEKPVEAGIANMKGVWEKKLNTHQEKQANNVFSGNYQGVKQFDKDHYGKAPEGSKTEERAKAASEWVDKEIDKLIEVIMEMGTFDPEEGGLKTVQFGPLFYKYADISDTLVGILMRAKKRNRLIYKGDMLFQNRHDHVKITVLKAS